MLKDENQLTLSMKTQCGRVTPVKKGNSEKDHKEDLTSWENDEAIKDSNTLIIHMYSRA